MKTFYIKNAAGILKLTVDKEIPTRDVARHCGDSKLPEMKCPRLEFHYDGYSHIVTLYDDLPENMKIYVAEFDYDRVHIYEAHFDSAEESCYVTDSNELVEAEKPVETCRERLKREHPEFIDIEYIGGCSRCPINYGYAGAPDDCNPAEAICTKCWDRPVEGKDNG